jgi:hypothetical protein
MTKAISVMCTALSKQTGKPCKLKAIPGGTVCRFHGGAAKQVKAKAAVRAELITWGVADALDDPGEVLLRLVTQSRNGLISTPISYRRLSRQRSD